MGLRVVHRFTRGGGLVSILISWLLVLIVMASEARRVHEVRAGFDVPCEGELCHESVFCWRGARFADLNQLTRRIHAEVEFQHESDMCVDAEMDDALSFRSLLFGYDNETAAIRLSNRIGSGRSWLSHLILDTVFGTRHKSTGDGVCIDKKCTVHFSPYGLSCMRLCGERNPKDQHTMHAEIRFRVESVLDSRALTTWFFGLLLGSASRTLSERPEVFYLTGGSLGVMFAVALLVLIVSRMTTRSGPTKAQLGLAAVFQVGVVYARNAVYEFIKNYIDWIALYVIVTFVASLGLVHYFLKGEDGKVRLSSSLKDIVRIALQLLASFLMASPITSARYRLIITLGMFTFSVLSHWADEGFWSMLYPRLRSKVQSSFSHLSPRRDVRFQRQQGGFGRDKSPAPPSNRGGSEVAYSAATTPHRQQERRNPLSGEPFLDRQQFAELGQEYTQSEMKKLVTPGRAATEEERQFLEWLLKNHHRIQLSAEKPELQKDVEEEDEEDEEDVDEEVED